MPPETWKAFIDHGVVRQTLAEGTDEAKQVLNDLQGLGICMEHVCSSLQKDGVKAFSDSLDSLLKTLEERRQMALAAGGAR